VPATSIDSQTIVGDLLGRSGRRRQHDRSTLSQELLYAITSGLTQPRPLVPDPVARAQYAPSDYGSVHETLPRGTFLPAERRWPDSPFCGGGPILGVAPRPAILGLLSDR